MKIYNWAYQLLEYFNIEGTLALYLSLVINIFIIITLALLLDYIFKKEGLSIKEGIDEIKKAGVDSIPGGGAEIFDENIRNLICPEKVSSNGSKEKQESKSYP